MTDKEIIREQANIDISNLHIAQKQGIITEFGKGKLEALEGIVDFIDSMQEKLVSENLEEAASMYAKEEYDHKNPATLPDRCRGCYAPLIYAFKAGAEWKEEQMMKDTIDTKEEGFEIEQRIKECPYRQVGCTIYNDHILECRGACSWVVDYPKLKEIKTQTGE